MVKLADIKPVNFRIDDEGYISCRLLVSCQLGVFASLSTNSNCYHCATLRPDLHFDKFCYELTGEHDELIRKHAWTRPSKLSPKFK